jgi:hypothetical protein
MAIQGQANRPARALLRRLARFPAVNARTKIPSFRHALGMGRLPVEIRPVCGARFAFLGAEFSASSEQLASPARAIARLREIEMPAWRGEAGPDGIGGRVTERRANSLGATCISVPVACLPKP